MATTENTTIADVEGLAYLNDEVARLHHSNSKRKTKKEIKGIGY